MDKQAVGFNDKLFTEIKNGNIYHQSNFDVNQKYVYEVEFYNCCYIKGIIKNFEKCLFSKSDLFLYYTDDEVVFTDCDFIDTIFTYSSFSKVTFKNCSFNNTKFIECYAEQLDFKFCSFINEDKEKLDISIKEKTFINSIIKNIEEC